MRRQRREQIAISVTAAGLGAAAGWATETVVAQLARRVEGGETAARLTLAGAGAAASLLRLDSARADRGAARHQRAGGRHRGDGRLGRAGAPPRARLRPAAAGRGGRACRRRDGGPRRAPPARPQADRLPLRRLPADHLARPPGAGLRGPALLRRRRHRAGGRPGARLRRRPQRPDVRARCDLAVAELQRLGGFDRSRIVVCSATLRGYVNPIPLATEERLSDGDVAHVCVQYYDKRTPVAVAQAPDRRPDPPRAPRDDRIPRGRFRTSHIPSSASPASRSAPGRRSRCSATRASPDSSAAASGARCGSARRT